MGDKDDLLSQAQDARTMAICLQWCEPLFEKREKEVLLSLKALFRQGNYTEQVLACHVAQLTAIEDLRNTMKAISRLGESAQRELDDDLGEEE